MPSAFFTWQKAEFQLQVHHNDSASLESKCDTEAILHSLGCNRNFTFGPCDAACACLASFTANDAATEARLLKVDVLAVCTARAKIAGSHHLEGSQVVSGGSSAES